MKYNVVESRCCPSCNHVILNHAIIKAMMNYTCPSCAVSKLSDFKIYRTSVNNLTIINLK